MIALTSQIFGFKKEKLEFMIRLKLYFSKVIQKLLYDKAVLI